MVGRLIPFPLAPDASDQAMACARSILEIESANRADSHLAGSLADPEVLLNICASIRDLLNSSPGTARREAEFFHHRLRDSPQRVGLFEEHEYFLGEFALIAGTACRQLSLRDEARLWFDRAEAGFRLTANAVADLSRLSYQRLALRMEERQLESVLELAPPLVETFKRLGLQNEELKARFLEAIAFVECDRLDEATSAYEVVCRMASESRAEHLLAQAYGNLIQIAAMRQDTPAAVKYSNLAIPVLRRQNDRVALAKAQWALGSLLRECGRMTEAIAVYREAQEQFQAIEMRADVAAIDLIVADLQLELGNHSDALKSVVSALPVIDELEMVPEGIAALQLVRESVRQRRLDRKALRDLHGYFDDLRH